MNYLQNLPVGKALVPVEVDEYDCDECFFNDSCEEPHCISDRRVDGKDVIYKLVDVETFNFKEKEMVDKEWVEKALHDFQRDELTEVERVKKACAALEAAKKELADAKESLKGIRGCITEMTWQLDYYKEHGKLP